MLLFGHLHICDQATGRSGSYGGEINRKGQRSRIVFNEPLNILILKASKSFFDVDDYHILDHDHTKLYTNKPDARACYRGKGYYASCFSTDQIPLYFSLQSGNATPKTNLIEALTTGFEAMKQKGLTFDTFRAPESFREEPVTVKKLQRLSLIIATIILFCPENLLHDSSVSNPRIVPLSRSEKRPTGSANRRTLLLATIAE